MHDPFKGLQAFQCGRRREFKRGGNDRSLGGEVELLMKAEAWEQRGVCADQTYTSSEFERLRCYRVDKGWAWARPLPAKQLSQPAVTWPKSDESDSGMDEM